MPVDAREGLWRKPRCLLKMDFRERHILACNLQSLLQGVLWPTNAKEPDYVAKLVEVLPGFVKSSLLDVMPGRTIAAGSAFIHQKPLAHFINRMGCSELGDLLLVCRENRFSGNVYNALLLQAKRTATPFSAQIRNDHQYVLYSEWPYFEYRHAGALNGKRRSVLPKTITQGAQYLLIDESGSVDLFTATVDRPLNGSKLFARTLAAVLSFDAGRTFQVTSPRDDWSQMVLDLLRLSASAVFNRRNSGYVGAKRWNGDEAFDYILNSDGPEIELMRKDVEVNEDFSGISVVCIDLGDSGNQA